MSFTKMIVSLVIYCAFFASAVFGSRLSPVVSIDESTGEYAVILDNEKWFSSSEVYLRANNRLYSTEDKSLQFQHVSRSTGQDNLGRFVASTLTYSNDADKLSMKGVIKQYEE